MINRTKTQEQRDFENQSTIITRPCGHRATRKEIEKGDPCAMCLLPANTEEVNEIELYRKDDKK